MPVNQQRVQIALQKSGRLTEQSMSLLERCGIKFSRSKDQLFCFGENMPVDILFVRDDDIPELVGEHVCDLGIVGENVSAEKRFRDRDDGEKLEFECLRDLDFGRCRLVIATPEHSLISSVSDLAGRRIATSYPGVLRNFLQEQNIDAEIIFVSGAVEITPKLDRADLICDLVSTGATLAANQLVEFKTILECQAQLISNANVNDTDKQSLIDRLVKRLDGVLQVRESKYIMLHAPRNALPQITDLLPGSESPTIVPLDGSDQRVAVHAVCRETVFWETLEDLKDAGASSLLVLPVEKMLA